MMIHSQKIVQHDDAIERNTNSVKDSCTRSKRLQNKLFGPTQKFSGSYTRASNSCMSTSGEELKPLSSAMARVFAKFPTKFVQACAFAARSLPDRVQRSRSHYSHQPGRLSFLHYHFKSLRPHDQYTHCRFLYND